LTPDDPRMREQLRADMLPQQWGAPEAIAFMKESTKQDPLAIVAFVGDEMDAGQGFMVMQIPAVVTGDYQVRSIGSWYVLVLLIIFALFIAVSWLFFIGIRKRLLRLQTAMSFTGGSGIPQPIAPGRADEIGRLEEAFNSMVAELSASRQRELEEEGLRKRLVSDLSHDLRTPLTVIRSHLHVLGKEVLSQRGQESLELMDIRIDSLSGLIENLLSYNLLSSGRMTLKLEQKDVLRVLRESAAAWYPLWEKEGFEAAIDLEAEPLYWVIDESWFRRILDNLFQNIMRHAHDGQYVGSGRMSGRDSV
ncbi:HAMP domain-containing sensor histidine kinase, partial [Paenibacillus ihuae]|uniref:HAMP domain-containing sensor histidine kinase n=1 Tax=Paenibacillus ihuae TaxID=1232431 RepID=UPI001428A911